MTHFKKLFNLIDIDIIYYARKILIELLTNLTNDFETLKICKY